MQSPATTYFASPQRADAQTVTAQHRKLQQAPVITQMLNSFPEPAMVLNRQRQVILANDKLLALLNKPPDQVVGSRPGELFRCVHAWDCESGCGTSRFCRECGAGRAIVAAVHTHEPRTEECRLTCSSAAGNAESLDLRVIGSPLQCEGEEYMVFAIRDITDEKRRAILERLFFHDVLNAAGGLLGLIDMCAEAAPEKSTELLNLAVHAADQLVEEIRSFRDLTEAERGDLRCSLTTFDVVPLLSRAHVLYRSHPAAEGKSFPQPVISGGATTVYSDEVLLSRVLGNLLKNAFEAAAPGTAVQLRFEASARPVISVHNEGWMSPEVQMQIFQRSFSTKASSGRGVGTYSVKLLTERYLRGEVGFTSSRETGTTFFIILPRAAPRE